MTGNPQASVRQSSAVPLHRPIKILYIAGCGRSGSTLMMRLLAEETGGVAVGELFHLWNNGYRRNFVCGCGARFAECPFWGEVTKRALGPTQKGVDVDRMRRLQRRVHGPRALFALRNPLLRTRGYRDALSEYMGILGRVYEAIADIAGSDCVIDASKSPQLARFLSLLPEVQLHVVHLVRDSRATAWSWSRVRAEPALGDAAATMRRYPVWRSALEWTLNHAIILFDRNRSSSYALCKYEQLADDPQKELQRAVPWADGPSPSDGMYVLGKSHSVTGNPNRFHAGPVSITLDDEWETAMPARDRLIVTAISGLLLKRLGYPLRKPARR